MGLPLRTVSLSRIPLSNLRSRVEVLLTDNFTSRNRIETDGPNIPNLRKYIRTIPKPRQTLAVRDT